MEYSTFIDWITCNSCVVKLTALFRDSLWVENVLIRKDTGKVSYEHVEELSDHKIEEVIEWTKYSLKKVEPVSVPQESFSLRVYTPLFTLFWDTSSSYVSHENYLLESLSLWDLCVILWHDFFLAFSYFKMINLKEFAMSYSMYDILAKKWKPWWYVYAFIELWLGISYLLNSVPLITNIITFVVMSISIIGVIQSVLNKKQIKCACLGAVFNLPMSTITILEDALMIVMSGAMILWLL